MTDTTLAEMQTLLTEEFERQGWVFDLAVARQLGDGIERSGAVDAEALARRVSSEFLHHNGAKREDVAAAIHRAIGGRTVAQPVPVATVTIDNRSYTLEIGAGAQITDSNVLVGEGTQVHVDTSAPKTAVLEAVAALLQAGLMGNWNAGAAVALASTIDGREDVDVDDVRTVTADVVAAERPTQGRAKALLREIAAGGVAGALGTGISSGLGEVIAQLPL